MMMRRCHLLLLVLGVMEISGDSVMERLSIHEHFSQVSKKEEFEAVKCEVKRGGCNVIDDEWG